MTVEFLGTNDLYGVETHWFEIGSDAYGITAEDAIVDGDGQYLRESPTTGMVREVLAGWSSSP